MECEAALIWRSRHLPTQRSDAGSYRLLPLLSGMAHKVRSTYRQTGYSGGIQSAARMYGLIDISDISQLIHRAIEQCDAVGAYHTACHLQLAVDTLATEAKKIDGSAKMAPPNPIKYQD